MADPAGDCRARLCCHLQRGEARVKLHNDGAHPVRVERGERIAQAMLIPAPQVQIVEADDLSDTARGEGGFGSTGK